MRSRSLSLLEAIQGLLERTYALRAHIGDPGRFIIGDEGYRRLYGASHAVVGAERISPEVAGPRTLVREVGGEVLVCVYYPDALIGHLERHPPQRGLGDDNVDEFASFVEELDHLLCIAERAALGRPCTLFELELHANVSKHIVLRRFLAGGSRRGLDAKRGHWLRYHLFYKKRWSDPDPGVRARYEDASRWALRFLAGLDRLGANVERIATLRRFHAAATPDKIDLIRGLGAH